MPDPAPAATRPPRSARDGDPAITLSGIAISRGGVRVIDGLDAALGPSGITAVMGPNGAGKSLMLRVIAGLLPPDGGTITFAGGRPAAPQIALVFQTPVLLRRSVRANLDLALTAYGVPRRDRPAKTAHLLDMAGLAEHANRPARALSGGERQRLALVRALGAQPKFLLLDEPTASLDPQATAMIEALIAKAVADGIRVVLVTHDQGQARRLSDDVIFLHRGRIVETTPASQFFETPASREARAYLAGSLLI